MGEHAATVDDVAAQLVAVLQVQGNKGRSEWSELHGKLAEVAAGAGGDDPTRAVKALLDVAKDASSSQALTRALEERVSKANLKNLVSLVAHQLTMTPLCDSHPVHMVDEDSNFCKESVDHLVNCSAELSAPDAPYAVISIVGAQSSGKSFLLNHLFGTRFPEMDSKGKRCQTTRGIMMSRCIEPSLILLDVEGFDGKERNQDTLFEKQAALFALTVSDIMMVNIPKMSIGLEQGGANPLFRIIFQERTKLPKGITKLLVVVRYYDGEPSLEIMRTQVLESLEEIWISVNNESEKFKDYIEVNIVGLPDKHWPQFPKEVAVLRKLLSNNRSSKYTASSFSVSSSWFWDTIKKNKKLDIVSHQVALAKYFCREEADNIVKSVKSQEKYKLMSEEDPGRFQEISHELLEEMKNKYDLSTKMYDPDVMDNESQYMVERLHEIFRSDSRKLIWKAQENTLEEFKHEFYTNTQNMKEANADLYFERIVDAYIDKSMSSFEDLKVFDTDYLHMICGKLKSKMQSYTAHHIEEVKVNIARSYCQQLVQDILNSLESQEKYKLLKSEESPGRFKETSHQLLEKIKSEYDLSTKMYDPDVRDNERQYMVERLHENIKDLSKELIRKVYENTIEQFKHEFAGKDFQNMKDAEVFFQNMKHELLKYVCEFTSTFKDLKLVDWDHLQNSCEELKKKLEAYADQTIKIIRFQSRELIHVAQGCTLEKFEHEFNKEKIKNMEDANAYISKCIDEFMSSFKDSKLVDSKYLQNIREELEKKLEAHADNKIKAREERKAQKKIERVWKAVKIAAYAVATPVAVGAALFTGDVVTPTLCLTKLVKSSVDLYNHDVDAAQDQSEDDHCDLSSD